jgi:hypothetical protein
MTDREVMSFVRKHGVVLMAAKGPVPRLTEWIAGEAIRGSWWSHAKGRDIYARLSKLSSSPNILICRLIDGHVTFVHLRLWPALVRLADRFPPQAIASIRDVHTASGKHVTEATPFPAWVPPEVLRAGRRMEQQVARAALHMVPELASRAPARHGPGKSRAASKRRPTQRRG